ncbi:hypothetical protein BC939DRAFT_440513 [Gamsiella multidivaricata]|uniref:uncharacterized protein n=1 Tax=Gamsiella multidivaricata TaxID=101098 RepID=UPI0022207C07|nr:uncharacterized protein BC939DRAFT_440513 [Gamsiella multidivaricata]KAI7829765.1 hypothetical protein BC939DRAFT_440513 [Gamsiella multidivaricata]
MPPSAPTAASPPPPPPPLPPPQKKHPLEITEVLILVGQFIPFWDINPRGDLIFLPKNLLPCLSVSKHFRRTLLPMFWRIVDGYIMCAVPLSLLRKYKDHVRVLRNFSYQRNFHNRQQPQYGQLIELQSTYIDEAKDLILASPCLRNLSLCAWRPRAEDEFLFSHLTQLRTLHLMMSPVVFNGLDPRFLSRALEPVSSSLVSLYMDAIVFQVACIGQLILPALKLLRLDGDCVGVFEELPQRCPNLETIDVDVLSQLSVGHLVQLFHSGGCPRLVNWTTTTGDEKFARVLRAHRRGIKELEAEVDVVSDEISHGIKHHAATLKKLKLLSTVEQEETQPFLLDILQSCHQLESFEYEDGADEWDMTAYLDTANWKNPGSLKSLAFKSYDLTFGGICLDGPEAAAAVGDADLSILGWRMQTWGATCGRDHSRVFLQAVFKHAQAFEQLKAITLNGIVYKRGL